MSQFALPSLRPVLVALALGAAPFGDAADLSKGRPPLVLDARIGPNLRLGDDPSLLPSSQRGQAEPHLIRSTTDPNLLLATFQEGRFPDAGAVSCGYAVSRDGGLTWRRALVPSLVALNGGRYNRATDPVAGAGPQGELYLQNLVSIDGAFNLGGLVISRSLDGGDTWTTPMTIFESAVATTFPDKNWLAVNDYPGRPNSGRLVSTWTNFLRNAAGATLSANIVASVSDDRGSTWSTPVPVTPANSVNQGSQPLFLPDGSLGLVYITFLNPANVTTLAIDYKRSVDGGRSFPAAPTRIVPLLEGWDDPQLRDGVFLPSAAVALSAGTIFVSYVAMLAGTPRVFVTHSTDSGATWNAPIVVSDQPAGISVMNPAVATSADGRTVAVVFMDKRDAPNGRDFVDNYLALSFDGGITWQPNLRVTDQSSELRYGPQTSRGVMLGDYFAVVPSPTLNEPWVAIWCDTRTGDADPFVARFAPVPEASFDAWRIARFRAADHTTAGRSSAAGDPDGDGLSNLFEYQLGTDPLAADHGDPFVVEHLPSGGYSVSWTQRAALPEPPLFRVAANPAGEPTLGGGRSPTLLPPIGLEWRTAEVRQGVGTSASLAFQVEADGLTGSRFPALNLPGPGTAFGTDARLVNLSTRAVTGDGTSPPIVGFVLDGPKSVLVRAAGPALAALGLRNVLADPRLSLSSASSTLALANDNWSSGNTTPALFIRLGAFPFAPGSLDAALLVSLEARSYSVVVTSPEGSRGVAIVEAYDAETRPGAAGGARFANLSTRGEAGAGADALIAGFVLSGTEPRRVLIRAVGPGLGQFGMSGYLPDPRVEIYRGELLLAHNDDWERGRSPAAVAASAQQVGAFALPRSSLDAALLLTLSPGAYTAIVTGADGRSGLALIEIYDAD